MTISIDSLSASDPTARWEELALDIEGVMVPVKDDAYSDRIRCDHPPPCSARTLGKSLIELGRERSRGRVVLLAPSAMRGDLVAEALVREATMPGFYGGEEDCDVFGIALHTARSSLVDPLAVGKVDEILRQDEPKKKSVRTPPPTERATEADAEAIARLVDATFERYPTPTGVPAYVAEQIREGVPFRIVREGEDVVACASADLVRSAKTAELTDCATRPDQRGRGLMQGILLGLMDNLREIEYPTAFTLARATIPGVNLAFKRLGFIWRGQMRSSCRIGDGIEDMNVWSRPL